MHYCYFGLYCSADISPIPAFKCVPQPNMWPSSSYFSHAWKIKKMFQDFIGYTSDGSTLICPISQWLTSFVKPSKMLGRTIIYALRTDMDVLCWLTSRLELVMIRSFLASQFQPQLLHSWQRCWFAVVLCLAGFSYSIDDVGSVQDASLSCFWC